MSKTTLTNNLNVIHSAASQTTCQNMPQILIFLKQKHQILTASRSNTPKFAPFYQHLISTFCINSGFIKKNPLLTTPHISFSATSLQDCCKLSHSLYTETAPWLQTPPLKLMSAAKFSLLQICINSIPAINPPCLAPGMSLMCFPRSTLGVSHSLPHQGHVYS